MARGGNRGSSGQGRMFHHASGVTSLGVNSSFVPDDTFERRCLDAGYRFVAGVDEAGRGPLAGPVVAAAVILPHPCPINGLRDSKTITPEKREQLYEIIMEQSIDAGVGISEPEVIDRVNILQATLLAMREAVESLKFRPDIILVDGISRAPLAIPQKLIKKGDRLCISVAAASIVAKVTRDRIMRDLHKRFPAYGFDSHFGYGTSSHLDALGQNGPCPAHRKTFRPVKKLIGDS